MTAKKLTHTKSSIRKCPPVSRKPRAVTQVREPEHIEALEAAPDPKITTAPLPLLNQNFHGKELYVNIDGFGETVCENVGGSLPLFKMFSMAFLDVNKKHNRGYSLASNPMEAFEIMAFDATVPYAHIRVKGEAEMMQINLRETNLTDFNTASIPRRKGGLPQVEDKPGTERVPAFLATKPRQSSLSYWD